MVYTTTKEFFMTMSIEKQKEIALKLVIQRFKAVGINENLSREIGNIAKSIGCTTDEVKEFFEAILPEILKDVFNHKKVTLSFSD